MVGDGTVVTHSAYEISLVCIVLVGGGAGVANLSHYFLHFGKHAQKISNRSIC